MARILYIPFNEDFANIFTQCEITAPVEDFGGNEGWGIDNFNDYVQQAIAYLNGLFDDDDPTNDPEDSVFDLLEAGLPTAYWSTEGIIPG